MNNHAAAAIVFASDDAMQGFFVAMLLEDQRYEDILTVSDFDSFAHVMTFEIRNVHGMEGAMLNSFIHSAQAYTHGSEPLILSMYFKLLNWGPKLWGKSNAAKEFMVIRENSVTVRGLQFREQYKHVKG